VGVTADDDPGSHRFEDRDEPVLGRQPGEDLVVVAGCRMAEQHLANATHVDCERRRPALEELHIPVGQLLSHPPDDLAKPLRDCARLDAR
jgi:hypothetical protein